MDTETEVAGLGIEYKKFVQYSFEGGKIVNPKRMVEGKFHEKGSEEIHTESFKAWDVQGDAFESYRAAVGYFNFTLRPHEKKRIPISAKWLEEQIF